MPPHQRGGCCGWVGALTPPPVSRRQRHAEAAHSPTDWGIERIQSANQLPISAGKGSSICPSLSSTSDIHKPPLALYSLQPFCLTRSLLRLRLCADTHKHTPFRRRCEIASQPWHFMKLLNVLGKWCDANWWYERKLGNKYQKGISPSRGSVKVLPVIIQHRGKTACQFKSCVYGLLSNLWLHLLSAIEVCDKLWGNMTRCWALRELFSLRNGKRAIKPNTNVQWNKLNSRRWLKYGIYFSFFPQCFYQTCPRKLYRYCAFQLHLLYKRGGCISPWWGVTVCDVVLLGSHWLQGVAHCFTVQFHPVSSPLISWLFVLATRRILSLVWRRGVFSQPIS